MGRDSYPKKLTGSGDTTLGSCLLYVICVNAPLTGTVAIKEGAAAVGTLATSTAAGSYHIVPNGGRFANLVITLSAADDVTVYVQHL